MIRSFLKRVRWLLLGTVLLGIPLLQMSCGGQSIAPPAPPAEIPAPVVLKFVTYEDIKIDLSTISAAEPASVNVYNALGAGGEFYEEIGFGPTSVREAEGQISVLMAILGEMEIPVGEDITTFPGSLTIIDEELVITFAAKFDFGDFDFDGDGATEGCSGHTGALPVCVRMWLELDGTYQRAMAWVFEEYVEEGSPGKSRFKIFYESQNDPTYLDIAYDHRDLENRSTEISFKVDVSEEDLVGDARNHVLAQQVGPEATALKTVNLSAEMSGWFGAMEGDPDSYSTMEYLGQFKEGEDLWSGSVNATGVFASELDHPNFTDLCAVISTSELATNQTACDTLGISVAGIPFVDPLDVADVAIPPDFPENPTF